MRASVGMELLFASALTLAAAGCGVGGQDGASIERVQPPAAAAVLNVGDRAQLPLYTIQFTGDLNQLNGKTVYILVEDPGAIVDGEPTIWAVGTHVEIGMAGNVLDAVGTRSGQLVFHACLDAGCGDELPGSPSTSTYAFDVHPGLVVDAPDLIELTAAFAEELAAIEIPVTLPVGSSALEASATLCIQDYSGPLSGQAFCGLSALGPPRQSTSGPLLVRIDPRVGWPGTYTDMFHFQASSNLGGYLRVHERTITVRYTITAEGGPPALFYWYPVWGGTRVMIDPGTGFEVAVSDELSHELGLGCYTKAGFVTWDHVDYTQSVPPTSADPLAPYDNWFETYDNRVAACHHVGPVRHCMSAGTYGATLEGHVDDGGAGIPVSLPVTMHVGAIP